MSVRSIALSTAIVRVKDLQRWRKKTAIRIGDQLRPLSSAAVPFLSGPTAAVNPAPYLERVQRIISQFSEPADNSMIQRAFELAWRGHSGQFRKSGEPYIDHPLAVAEMAAEHGLGKEEIAAALCHDLIEDTKKNAQPVTKEFLREQLGERVAQLVDGVTELGKESQANVTNPSRVDIYKKWVEYGTKDTAVLVLKLFDRLHNMRTLQYTQPASREKKARETIDVYAKIADTLGMWALKRELEDLCFCYLDHDAYETIARKYDEIVANSKKEIDQIVDEIKTKLAGAIDSVEIVVEPRHIYELHQRMERRGISSGNICPTDLWRINIIVPDRDACYRTLGSVHYLYRSVEGFFDHISKPALNGHRFLHTYVEVPGFGRLLVQIRDENMQANYKAGLLSTIKGKPDWYKKSPDWLEALLAALKEAGVADGATLKIFGDVSVKLTVFTPRGEPHRLPGGSTVLDFARRIHEQIFLHAVGAKVNGQVVPLSHILREDDRVEIITDDGAWPCLEWMEIELRTPEARAGLRTALRKRAEDNRKEAMAEAMKALNEAAQKYSLSSQQLIQTALFLHYLSGLSENQETFLLSVAAGKRRVKDVVAELFGIYQRELQKLQKKSASQPYCLTIKAVDRPGLLSDLTGKLKRLGFNIFTDSINSSAGKVIIILRVDVVGGDKGGGMAGQIQRQQIMNIAAQFGDMSVISPEMLVGLESEKEKLARKLGA